MTLGIFLKNTATRYRIGSRIKASQPCDNQSGALPIELHRRWSLTTSLTTQR